MLNEAHKQMHM